MLDRKECFEQGLLRKTTPSEEKGMMSLGKSRAVLEEAEKNLGVEAFDSCVTSSYMAMFHAARAILFRDGFREKSHYCLARYLDLYVERGALEQKWVDLLDRIRDLRHAGQYDFMHASTEEEAKSILKVAHAFVDRLDLLLGCDGQ